MDISEVYKRVFSALDGLSLGSMVREAYEIMQMPIVVTDAAFVVLGKYPLDPVEDEQWDDNMINRQIHAKYISIFQHDQHWPAYEEMQHTIYLDWGYFENSPRYSSNCTVRGKTVGYIAALATGVEREPWHIEAFDIITQACATIIEADGKMRRQDDEVSNILFQALLRDELKERSDFEYMRALSTAQLDPGYALVAIEPRRPFDTPLIMYLEREMTAYFGKAPSAVQDNCLYVLLCDLAPGFDKQAGFKRFVRHLSANETQCGVSCLFDELYPLTEPRWQAEKALRVGRKARPRRTLFLYDDCRMDVVVSILQDNASPESIVHPALSTLARYDRDHDTRYLETLEAFLLCEQDRAYTIEKLHIHRNTLVYRLDKIREIAGLDSFDGAEGLYLYLSFLLVRSEPGTKGGLGNGSPGNGRRGS